MQDRFIHKTFNNFVFDGYKKKKWARECVRFKLNLHVPQRKLKLNRLVCFDSPTAYSFIVMIFEYLPVPKMKVDFIAVTAIIAIVHKTKRTNIMKTKKKCIHYAHQSQDYKTSFGCVVVSNFLSVCDLWIILFFVCVCLLSRNSIRLNYLFSILFGSKKKKTEHSKSHSFRLDKIVVPAHRWQRHPRIIYLNILTSHQQ